MSNPITLRKAFPFGVALALILPALAVSGVLSGKPAAASITAQNHPYVVSEYKTSAKGVAQPEVIGPDGTLVVDSAGVIQDAKAGTIGNTTQTDGLQEGINYAVNSGLDLYITGGRATGTGGVSTNNNVYFLSTTLRIPAAQDFRIDGGESIINYNPTSGDALTIDSCEDCHFRFGLVVTGATNGSAVMFKPTNPTNLDQITVITDSTFEFSSIASSKPTGTSAYALNFDATNGPILWNDFNATATVGYQTNVRLHSVSASNAVIDNNFRIVHNHMATVSLLDVSQYSDNNHWNINDDRNATTGVGADIHANGNVMTVQSSGFPAGNDVIFENGAIHNLLLEIGTVSTTDHNAVASNKIINGTP